MKVSTEQTTNHARFLGGAAIAIFGAYFWLMETRYFGWNITPSCEFEGLCDFASILIMVCGIGISATSKQVSVKVETESDNTTL